MDLVTLQPTVQVQPPRLIIHGLEGVGKTNLAAQCPGIVMADVEKGLDGIRVAREPINSWMDMITMKNAMINQPHKFGAFGLDTLDWMERIIHSEVARVNKVSSIDDIGYGKGYGFALEYWDAFLHFMNEIREKRGMLIILLAHTKIKSFNDPMGNSYDRYQLKLHDKAAALVQEWADGILFMRNKPILVTEKTGFSDVKKAQSGGVHMYTKESPAHVAKNRASLSLPAEFPISKDNAWNDFTSQLGKGAKQQ